MRLREARKAARLTQSQLAERLGVSQPLICEWESGREAVPDGQKGKIMKILGRSVDWRTEAPLTVNEQRQMFQALELVANRVGHQKALGLFKDQPPDELRTLTDFVLSNATGDLLLPPGVVMNGGRNEER